MNTLTANDILCYIDEGIWAIPEQYDYFTWKRKDVLEFIKGLYCKTTGGGEVVLADATAPDDATLIINGSVIVNTIYSVLRGTPSPYFSGDAAACTGIWFNYDTEDFAFYEPDMEASTWLSVSDTIMSPFDRIADICASLPSRHAKNILRLYDMQNNTFTYKNID